jgi:dimethylglycine dehydrogenase
VTITEMAASHTILVVAGPKSRELLQSLSPRCDWSKAAFPWLRAKEMTLAHAKVLAMSVSFSGELAYELHVPNEQLYLVWKLINEAGNDFGLSRFGLYATESMRMEKGYLHWKADLLYERNPIETGLDRFVKLEKPEFVGKQALEAELASGLQKKLVTMTIDCEVAAAHAGDSVYISGNNEEIVGTITSGAYGHRVAKNIAYAFVRPELAVVGTSLSVCILGEHYEAVTTETCLYDPENSLVRA